MRFCPVAKKIANRKNPTADIGATNAGKPELGVATGKTGVPLRWHSNEEFHNLLPKAQPEELKKHQNKLKAANQMGGGKRPVDEPSKNSQKKLKGVVKSIVAPAIVKCMKEMNELVKGVAEIQQSVLSAMAELTSTNGKKKVSVSAAAARKTIAEEKDDEKPLEQARVAMLHLQSILKKSS